MKREELFKKWYKNTEHDYELAETLAVTDGNRQQDISFIYSGRNRAKSFEVATQCIADAWYDGLQLGYIRRNKETTAEIEEYFADKLDFIRDMTDGKADGITRHDGILKFYKDIESPQGEVLRKYPKVLGRFFALSTARKVKSHQFPNIYNMIYEEVLTDEAYLRGEPEVLLNLFSTVKRHKQNVHMYLISNLVSVVNPYSSAWGIYLTRQKPGEIKLCRLYLGTKDEKGEEEYYLIGTHYLKDKGDLSPAELKKDRKRVKTGITSNKWDELHLYPTLTLAFMKDFEVLDTAVFEYDDLLFQANIMLVPQNVYDVYTEDAEPVGEIPVLYIRRKTTEPYENTRLYTNNASRFSEYVTRGFFKVYYIDMVIEKLISRGWIFGTDNLCMNDFNKVFNNLRLMKLGY